jgi:hypothetical protein
VGSAVLMTAAAGTLPATAGAPEERPRPVVTSDDRYDAAAVRAAERGDDDPRAREARDRHLRAQAAKGRMLDRKNVAVAVLPNGTEAVWERGESFKSLRAQRGYVPDDRAADGKAGFESLAMETENEESSSRPAGAQGTGMNAVSGYSGGSLLWQGCVSYGGAVNTYNHIDGCGQRFKANDSNGTYDYYAYNRYGTATGKVVNNAPDYSPAGFRMRSKPRAGYENRVRSMVGYAPTGQNQQCGATYNLGVASLSLSVPMGSCSERTPEIFIAEKKMGEYFDQGASFEGRVHGVDFEMETDTMQGYLAPLMGNYHYAMFCQWSGYSCPTLEGLDGW